MQKIFLFFILIFLSLLSGCASLPKASAVPVDGAHHTIYFVYRHWHTSVVLDAKELTQQYFLLSPELHNEKFARIGWGDGDYFTGKNKTFTSATKALFVSGYSALQLLTYDEESIKDIPENTIVPLSITDEGFHRLVDFINHSVAVNAHNSPIYLPAVGADTGVFFQATGHYSVVNNCNTWSSKALQLAGLPLASRLTAQGVFEQAREISRIQQHAGLFASRL